MDATTNTATVHKNDHEGSLEIDTLTGEIKTPVDDRPDWADGLQVAMLAERTGWYNKRLGPNHAGLLEAIHGAPALNFADLSWVGHDAETGEEVELPADLEFRQEAIATILGIDREDGDTSQAGDTSSTGWRTTASVQNENDTDERLTPGYAAALDAETRTGFGLGSAATDISKTGTN